MNISHMCNEKWKGQPAYLGVVLGLIVFDEIKSSLDQLTDQGSELAIDQTIDGAG